MFFVSSFVIVVCVSNVLIGTRTFCRFQVKAFRLYYGTGENLNGSCREVFNLKFEKCSLFVLPLKGILNYTPLVNSEHHYS